MCADINSPIAKWDRVSSRVWMWSLLRERAKSGNTNAFCVAPAKWAEFITPYWSEEKWNSWRGSSAFAPFIESYCLPRWRINWYFPFALWLHFDRKCFANSPLLQVRPHLIYRLIQTANSKCFLFCSPPEKFLAESFPCRNRGAFCVGDSLFPLALTRKIDALPDNRMGLAS